jgi:flavorubredoxin
MIPASTTNIAPLAIELSPGRLYLLGASVELDGRISWVPPDASGWQPVNCYVLVEGDHVLVVDPGVTLHGAIVRDQLETIIPAGSPLSVFVTRAECDTTGGLGELAGRFKVETLYAGGGPNPFDAFEAITLTDPEHRSERIQMERTPAGFSIPIGETRALEMLRPSIRLLATWWGYDAGTRTLFTSDAFTHSVQAEPTDSRLLDDPEHAQCDTVAVRAHLLAKFGWLARARSELILEQLRAVFDEHEVDRIAPQHGLVIEGPDMVRRHVDALENTIKEMS